MKCHRQCVCLLLQVISFVVNCLAENLILNINFKKPIAVTDHAFLSFTLDPTTLQQNDFIKNIERNTNLARGLAPAYIRLGGPQSNFYNFEQIYLHEIDVKPNDMHFGTQWTLVYQWAKNAGLDVIACITPHYIDNELKTDFMDPRNIAELLSFSDRMGYNISWQLGYECQTRCDLSGEKLGQYVANLRKMLKTFPRYSNSLITGPDIVAYRTVQQQKYLQDYLHSANTALSAITWHPNNFNDLDSVSLNNDSISINYNNMIAEKEELYKVISSTAGEKPLWIVESKPQENNHQYLKALIWTKRLGDAAKLDIQVLMRQLPNLYQVTPVYWVSLLYKTLVGRKVLEIKLQSDNFENHVHFYSQCTKPSALYSNGAITMFGINLTPRKVTASLKDLKIKILHKYILSPDFETKNKMSSEQVLLNNKSLNLINDTKLPEINPEIIINPDGLELEFPSNSIGFWVIPNAKVKVCIYSEEETIENGIIKKLSKRHENDIQLNNQEDKEKSINQSNVIENNVKENKNQSNLKIEKISGKQNQKKQKTVKNFDTEGQKKIWGFNLFKKIRKFLQNRVQKKNKNNSSNLQRTFTIDFGEEQENSSEKVEEQQNLNRKIMGVDNQFKSIQDTFKKYKHILLKKKAEIEDIQDYESEVQSIDNIITLLSKIDAFLLYIVTSNEPINKIKDKAKNEEESIIKINKKLKEYFIELENSAEIKSNTINKIEQYFNKLNKLLEDNNLKKDNNGSQISINKDLMEKKRYKRHLDRKLKDSKKMRILKKRSQINDLKDHVIKQKIKQKNDDEKKRQWKLISFGNSKKILNNNKNKYNNLFQRDSVKKLFKSDVFKNTVHHIDHQNLIQKHKKIENDNIYTNTQQNQKSILDHTKYSKISNIENHQNLIEHERIKRDISKKFVDVGPRKDSAFRKRSRIDDLKNYLNERQTKQKHDIKREKLLVPFNPRTIDSAENNFYGFFRRDPIKGFPEGDIFVTTGDSLEQKDKDYDYVEDEDDSDDGSEKKNTQHSQKSMLDYTKDDIWVEKVENDHCNYMPNEFFENIKLSNAMKKNSKTYDDLWEAEFSEDHNNNNSNNNKNNNEITVVDSRYSSMSQLPTASTSNINYKASNAELKGTNQKLEPESKLPNSFYLPSQVSTTKYNYDNYQASINNDKLKEDNSFVMSINNRDDINAQTIQYFRPTNAYAEHSIHDEPFYNNRKKRSNWEKLRKIFAEEMIKEDEKNASRVIRATNSPKKLYYRRNTSASTAQYTDTSPEENKSMSADVKQPKKNVLNPVTIEEYDEIMDGEVLPNESVIESDYEKNDTTDTEFTVTELSALDHKLSNITQVTDASSISGASNISEQYDNAKKSTTSPVALASEVSLNNNTSVQYVKKETFFRTQSSDIQSDNKTKTYDSSQVISTIPSQNKNNQEELIVPVARNSQEATYEKVWEPIDEKEKTDSTIYSTTAENLENEEGHNNDYKIGLKSIDSLKETTKEIVEQVTAETILLQHAASTATDNFESNESKTESQLLSKIKDNQNDKSEAPMQQRNDINTRRIKTELQNLPHTSSKRLTEYEACKLRRAARINKLKEKLYARREKLLHQHQNGLTKIVDEQKRILKRREAWERLREKDDYDRLIDQREFIEILLDDDVTYEENDKSYSIPTKIIPKQYNNIIDHIYILRKPSKVHYPEQNDYQRLQNLIKDELEELEELEKTAKSSERKHDPHISKAEDKLRAETSRFLDSEHNQNCQSSETNKDERESMESTFRPLDHKVLIIDPSIYYGSEPILQLHEDYLKIPEYRSKIKSQVQDPITRWILRNFPEVLSRLKSNELQHQVSKSQEYIEKLLPIKDNYDQENINILHILDKQRQYDPLKKPAQIKLNSFDQRNVNQAVSDKEADKEINKSSNSNKGENNLNVKILNNNKADDVEKIINDDSKATELENENTRVRKDVEKQTDKHLPYYFRLSEDVISKLNSIHLKNSLKEIFDKESTVAALLTKINRPSSVDLLQKSKNYLVSSRGDFKIIEEISNEENDQEDYESNRIALVPIKIKNIYKILNAKDNDDSLESIEIPERWDEQYVLGKMLDAMNKYLDDKTSEEFEYEDLSTLPSENNKSIPNEECSCKKKQDISVENSNAESERNEQYEITSDELANERGTLLLLPWKNMKERQRKKREVKNEINEDITKTKRKVTRQSQSNKLILNKDLKNKRIKRYYLNNIVNEKKDNMIEMNDIKVNHLQSQINKKNHDNLLEDFIKTQKKYNLYNNKAFSVKNEEKNKIIPLSNNVLKNDKKLLQEKDSKRQDYVNSMEESVSNSEKNFNGTLTDEDEHHRNKISKTSGNTFHTAIMNIKDFFALFSGISKMFMYTF